LPRASTGASFHPTDGHVDSNWLGTVGGRVGVSFLHDHLLVFAKGGAGFTHFDFRTEQITPTVERFRGEDDTRTGGLVGGGLEYAFNCHWSLKVEYNHIFFGHDEVTGVERSGGGVTDIRTFRADGDRDTVVGGLNFKF
jgi:outer membrane immunogenic protein